MQWIAAQFFGCRQFLKKSQFSHLPYHKLSVYIFFRKTIKFCYFFLTNKNLFFLLFLKNNNLLGFSSFFGRGALSRVSRKTHRLFIAYFLENGTLSSNNWLPRSQRVHQKPTSKNKARVLRAKRETSQPVAADSGEIFGASLFHNAAKELNRFLQSSNKAIDFLAGIVKIHTSPGCRLNPIMTMQRLRTVVARTNGNAFAV